MPRLVPFYILFVCARLAAQAGSETPVVRATLATSAIHVDGRLDEPAWTSADSIPDLTQVEPAEGARPSGRTVVRVLVTGDAIVFGFRNEYAAGTPVVAFSRERDAILTNEDHI